MFLEKLLSAIGQFFKGLFNAARRTYKNLTPEQQEALRNGSGLVDVINSMLENTPAEIREAIKEKYPQLPLVLIEAALFKIAHEFNLVTKSDSLDDLIDAVQAELKRKEGKDWAVASHGMAVVLSVFLSPPATKVAAIVSLMEFVFQHFIKRR